MRELLGLKSVESIHGLSAWWPLEIFLSYLWFFNPLELIGIQTGRCIPYDQTRKTCEVFAWCPAEEGKEAPR